MTKLRICLGRSSRIALVAFACSIAGPAGARSRIAVEALPCSCSLEIAQAAAGTAAEDDASVPWYQSAWAYTGLGVVFGLALFGVGYGIATRRGRGVRRRVEELEGELDLLRENEGRYRTLIENTEDLVWAADADLRYIYVNPRFRDVLRYEVDELIGRSPWEFADDQDREQVQRWLENAGEHQQPMVRTDWSMRDAKGGVHVVESSIAIVRSETGEVVGMRGIDRIVTDRVFLERKLRRVQKLEAVGRLAGGVAHDFNNLLTVLHGHASLLNDAIGPLDVLADHVHVIRKTVESGARLTKKLLTFSRQESVDPEVFSPNAVIGDMLEMIGRVIRDDIRLVCSLDEAAASIEMDRSGFEQTILNLVVNAADAMPDGGTLRIETEYVSTKVLAHADRVLVRVMDTGEGMDSTTLDQIFDPFFSTKEVGKGTGLGLAVVHGVVEQSKGTIRVRSLRGEGATFEMSWPVTGFIKPEEPEVGDEGRRSGSEMILVCDDDAGVRNVTMSMLKAAGYSVVGVGDPSAAELLATRGDMAIDLLVTDVVMPGQTGPDLARSISELIPDLRVMFMSGYPMDAAPENSAGEIDYLQKPFTSRSLLGKVRAVLDQDRDVG